MANEARKVMKTRKTKRNQGRRNGPASKTQRSPNRISDAKQRRPDAAASPRKNYDRYTALAREAASSGDAIQAENYYQYAEHYLRQMALS